MEVVTLKQIADALRVSRRGATKRANRESWPYEEQAVVGGRQRLYPLAKLPSEVQATLILKNRHAIAKAAKSSVEPVAPGVPSPRAEDEAFQAALAERIRSAEERWQRATHRRRDEAFARARALRAVRALVDSGEPLMRAREIVAAEMRSEGLKGAHWRSMIRWAERVEGADEQDWMKLLLDGFRPGRPNAECDPRAWNWYKSYFLCRSAPSHSSTYRRCVEVCQAEGWKVPSAKTLQRRMNAEVSLQQQVYQREGAAAAIKMSPPQQRSASHFAPGEAVNGDGLKFDRLWVRFEDGEVINTATGWFWQDVRTRKLLAWRVDKTENTDLFRLATYDLLGVCKPKYVYLDNTRVAANKVMTAGAGVRYRFKPRPEDGVGLLQMLDIEPHFTNPDKVTGNPGAKPIERAFGIGGLHEQVATHPKLVNRGFSKATAITVAELREVIAEEVARHNAQKNRRTEACNGILSFDEAWDQAVAANTEPMRVCTPEQRNLYLLSREAVTVDRNRGHITLKAGRWSGGANWYYSDALAHYAGRRVVAHFDPTNLSADVFVYDLHGTYLCCAQRQASRGFNDTSASRETAKVNKRRLKSLRDAEKSARKLSEIALAQQYEAARRKTSPPAAPAATPKVVAPHFGRVPNPKRDAAREAAAEDQTAREMRMDEFMKRAMAARERGRL